MHMHFYIDIISSWRYNCEINSEQIRMVSPVLNQSQISEIYEMLGALSSVCDNAMQRDGAGFSKADLIGHYITEMPPAYFDDTWSLISLLLIKKYKRQLAEFGFDVTPLMAILKEVSKEDVANTRSARATRQQRRVLMTEDGDFEIYFPNKDAMRGFNAHLPSTHDWISQRDIPHGYAFIVKLGARAFVANTVEQFSNWLIPDDVRSFLEDESLDTINVSDAVKHDLYILGTTLDAPLTLKWEDIHRFLPVVREFSTRSFNGVDAWSVDIRTVADLEMLCGLLGRKDCSVYVSPGVSAELKELDKKREHLAALEKNDEAVRKKAQSQEGPRCVVSVSGDSFRFEFTKFSYDFVNWIKKNMVGRTFSGGSPSFWTAPASDENVTELYAKLEDKEWTFKKSAAALVEDRYIDAIAAIAEAQRLRELALRISSQKLPDDDFVVDQSAINGTLLPFQGVVLQYNSIHKNMLIGDDMGLGKTLTSLACAAANKLHDAVNISCPAIARLTWRNEIQKWLPDATWYICKKANSKKNAAKEKEAILAADFVITSYNKMAVYQDVLAERSAKLFIGDESQYLKNPKSQRTQASMAVSEACDYVYLLSGTALKNRPRELATQLKMLRVLDSEFGGESNFLFTYCGPEHNGYGYSFNGSSNLSELRTKLRETCMVRRLKDDVMEFLPEKRRMRIPVEIANRKEYDKANADFEKAVVKTVEAEAKAVAKDNKLKGDERKAFIDDYVKRRVERAARAEMFVHLGILRQIVARGLEAAACEWIEGFCEDGEKLVVFVYHQEQQKQIYRTLSEKTGLRVGKIVSGMSDEQRKQVEEDFQAGLYDVVICSIMSANTNITLTASTTVLTVEYTWVPGDHIQAEDRCRRIGTSMDVDSINCYYLHAEDTVDDLFWETIVSKFEVIEQAMDNDEGVGFENLDEEVRSSIINGMMAQFDFVKSATKTA